MSQKTIFAAAIFSLMGAANAVELIVNGGFENSNPLAGWTSTSLIDPTSNAGAFGQPVHTGTSGAWLGGYGTSQEVASISQVVNIPASSLVTFSFWERADYTAGSNGGVATIVSASIGSVVVYSGPLNGFGNTTGFTQFTVNSSTLVGPQTVTFSYNHPAGIDNSSLYIDDVSVQAVPVPEPMTFAAVGLGLLALGLRRRK